MNRYETTPLKLRVYFVPTGAVYLRTLVDCAPDNNNKKRTLSDAYDENNDLYGNDDLYDDYGGYQDDNNYEDIQPSQPSSFSSSSSSSRDRTLTHVTSSSSAPVRVRARGCASSSSLAGAPHSVYMKTVRRLNRQESVSAEQFQRSLLEAKSRHEEQQQQARGQSSTSSRYTPTPTGVGKCLTSFLYVFFSLILLCTTHSYYRLDVHNGSFTISQESSN